MHRDEFRQVVNESVRESLAGQGFDSSSLSEGQLSQLTTAIADGVFAGLEKLMDAPLSTMNPTAAMAAAAATPAATAAAAVQDPEGGAGPLVERSAGADPGPGVLPIRRAGRPSGEVASGMPILDSPIVAHLMQQRKFFGQRCEILLVFSHLSGELYDKRLARKPLDIGK